MPTNLPAEWYIVKEEYGRATGKEKIEKLKKLLSVTPTHKGAEKLRAQLKKKLSELKKEEMKKRKLSRKSMSIPKEGCARVSIIGLPNSGKSTFLKKFTGAEPKIAEYPYTTTKPEVGMFKHRGILIQMIEIPSTLTREVLSIAHSSELVLFLVGKNIDEAQQLKELRKIIEKENFKRYIFVKSDIMEEELFKKIWKKLDLIRIYTKEHGKKKIDNPIIMKKGSKVIDLCKRLHKDFLRYFKYAKIKGPSAKFDWERVGIEHELEDGDIVEIHMKE
ncbi:MAG: TGS domain-containing protein [Candidatus Aenigmarchaeota archaeon]|nr:TGS domain-containing protein [Candidatus Aenigmarchaeota archaeon]